MSDETSPDILPMPTPDPLGIVCRECGVVTWKVRTTRAGFACIRRWRECAGCGHEVRTKEVIEIDGGPAEKAA